MPAVVIKLHASLFGLMTVYGNDVIALFSAPAYALAQKIHHADAK